MRWSGVMLDGDDESGEAPLSPRPPVAILLVDDQPRNLDALEAILANPEYTLLRASDADTALRLLLSNEVAAIVLDIQMPGVDGLELAQLIKGRRRFREIPLVFVTAHLVDDRDMLEGYSVGAVDFLTKPVNPQILRHKVAVFADLFRKTHALAELNANLEQRVGERTVDLERSEGELRQATRQKDEFLNILAHELRNPLAPLRTGLDLLADRTLDGAALDRTLQSMNRQLDHMVRLIDDLLRVASADPGLGLGLSQARSLAELHGGALASSESPDPAPPVRPDAGGTLRVVVIEDNADVADTLGDWLQLQGHQFWIARDGASGVAIVRERAPDVVLCDLGLPDIDGLAVCRAVRELSLPSQPMMIAVTGWGRDGDLERTREAGFDEHLVKPVKPEVLTKILQDIRPAQR